MYKDYKYIVTGATGYVGNCIVKRLLDDGLEVIGLIRNEKKAQRVFKDKKPLFVKGDIRDQETIDKLFAFADEKTVVIHTAAEISIGEGDIDTLISVNVDGTRKICEACLDYKVNKLLHISSSEAIPEGLKLLPDLSNYIPNPNKVRKGYNRSKSLADSLVMRYVKEHNLNASILIIAGVLGPGDYSLSHMSQMFIDFIKGKLPASIDGGYNDFDIRDLTNVLHNIVDKSLKGESYLFANRPDKINELLGYIAEKTKAKIPFTCPIWLAYMGLPVLWTASKIKKQRPLYTSSALASLRADVDYPLTKVKEQFGYQTRSLKETVDDHIDFLYKEGFID